MWRIFGALGIMMVWSGASMGISEVESAERVVILLGAPGSGKGTQAVELSVALSLPHISTGDLFRDNIKRGTSLGKKAEGFVNKGLLADDSLVLEMLRERVSQPDCAKGYILDGFPRTQKQAEALDAVLGGRLVIVFNLQVKDEEIVRRLTGRIMCRGCGTIYHKHSLPPAVSGRCDLCDGEIYQRKDDALEVVSKRLEVYHEQTKPLIAYYQKQNQLMTIDGQQGKEGVLKALKNALKV